MIEYTYNLYDLPSSHHRAGLAGLILLYQWMKEKGSFQGVFEVTWGPNTATVKLDPQGVEDILGEAFGAYMGEVKSRSPLKGLDLLREEVVERTVNEKTTKTKYYVYPQIKPRGSFLADWCSETWMKLWQGMVWQVIRGIPAARKPFIARAEGEEHPKDVEALVKALKRPQGTPINLSGSYALGIAAKNSEGVTFKDVNHEYLLLHFWPLVVDLHVPVQYDRSQKTVRQGYVIGIPDVCDLVSFVGTFPEVARGRKQEKLTDLYIENPLEGGAAYAAPFGKLVKSTRQVRYGVFAVDLYHMDKVGNSVKIFSYDRYSPTQDTGMIATFVRQAKKAFWVPLIRRHVIANLLDGKPPLEDLFGVLDAHGYHRLAQDKYIYHDVKALLDDIEDHEKKLRDAASIHVDYLLRRAHIPTFAVCKEAGKLTMYQRELQKRAQTIFSLCRTPEALEGMLGKHLDEDFDRTYFHDHPDRARTIALLAVIGRSTMSFETPKQADTAA